jgi:mannose-1-phosphate guanylyltransferase
MYIILMAGGVGTRFWPMSRKSRPKQLLHIVGAKSMLRLTFERIAALTDPDHILIITNGDQKSQIIKQLPEIPVENVIAEPYGRNTAPCVALATALVSARGQASDVMVVLPADHLVADSANFQRTIQIGAEYAANHECLLTLGIHPRYPETGYGYIQMNKKICEQEDREFYHVKTFAEKPNLETAILFLKSGDFLWNSGIFIWSLQTIMQAFQEYLPELGLDLLKISAAVNKPNFEEVVNDVYSRTKSVSIDYGIMEVAKKVCVLKANFDWNDLGSWEAVYNISPADANGNVVHSRENILINAKDNYFYSQKKLIAAINIEGLVVVEMDDALLICKKEDSQEVKAVVDQLNRKGLNNYL